MSSSFRAIILDTSNQDAPVAARYFHRADKYKDAWQCATAIVNGEEKKRHFFSDITCQTPVKLAFGKNFKVAAVFEVKTRNAKLDKSSIGEIMADKSLSAEQQLAKIAELAK